jgi:hypothetical protein
MGTMTFQLPAELPADAVRELEWASVTGGPDNMPCPSTARVDRGQLTVYRPVDESGCMVVPWAVDGAGTLMTTSATLMERPQPYQFQLELARGKINQLRCQAQDWLAGGLQLPPALAQQIRDASLAFGRAVTQAPSPQAGQQAQEALVLGYQTAEQLVRLYVDQVFQIRQQRQPRLPTALGCRLGTTPPQGEAATALVEACNTLCVPFAWSEVEPVPGSYHWEPCEALLDWAEARGLAVAIGPLIDFTAARLPAWLPGHDLPTLTHYMTTYVEAAVRRYHSRVRAWHLTAASNYVVFPSVSENELLWLTLRLVEAAQQIDRGLELAVGLAQPWGDYLAVQNRLHSPFLFADTLIRAGVNLGAFDLEWVLGVAPRGSYCRDLLDASRLLDLYALLGVPLRVTLGYPSADGPDPLASPELRVGAGHWHQGFNPQAQADWAADFAALALCKPGVTGVCWAHFTDAESHQFPHCGLGDAAGAPKPALGRLRELREKYLN